EKLVLDEDESRKARLHALWSLVGTGKLSPAFHEKLLAHKDPTFRAWGVRAAGNFGKELDAKVRDKSLSLATDSSRDVQLQVAIAAKRLDGVDPFPVYLRVLSACGDDRLVPAIVWQNLHPLLEDRGDEFVALLENNERNHSPALKAMMPRVVDRLLGRRNGDPTDVVRLFDIFMTARPAAGAAARVGRGGRGGRVQTGEIAGERRAKLAKQMVAQLEPLLDGKPDTPLRFEAALLATTLKDERGYPAARQAFAAKDRPEA